MKIGIFGGSFNPIHKGHEQIALLSIEELNLDKLFIIPVGRATHKKNNLINGTLRLKLCEKVFENFKNIEVSNIEVESNDISYTYKTLEKIIKKFGDENEYFEILGEDSIDYFEKWKNYKKILEKAKIVVFRREKNRGEYKHIEHNNIIYLKSPYFDFSSTKVREILKKDCLAKVLYFEKRKKLEKLLNKKIIKELIDFYSNGGKNE